MDCTGSTYGGAAPKRDQIVSEASNCKKQKLKNCTLQENSALMPNLPEELLITIFEEIAKQEIKEAIRLSCICKDWKRIIRDNTIWQVFAKNQMPHLLTHGAIPRNYFDQAITYTVNLNRITKQFSDKNRHLINYPSYRKKLYSVMELPAEIYQALPYFDLRPLAFLRIDECTKLFNRICPMLKNIEVLEVGGIGTKIGFHKIHWPKVAGFQTKMTVAAKTMFDGLSDFIGAERPKKKSQELLRHLLPFWIAAIGKVSGKLATLQGSYSSLTANQLEAILKNCPTISCVDIRATPSIFMASGLKVNFPKVEFKTS